MYFIKFNFVLQNIIEGIEDYLCPPLGFDFSLQGQYMSETFAHLRFAVDYCHTNYDGEGEK